MRKNNLRRCLGALLIFTMLLTCSAVCLAEGASLLLLTRSTTVKVGDEFRVVMAVSGGMPDLVCFGPVTMDYDTSLFTFVEARQLTGTGEFRSSVDGNTVTVMNYNGNISFSDSTYLVGVYFKAKKTGTGSFSLGMVDGFSSNLTDTIPVAKGGSLSITVTEPVIKSSNNRLKSLDVDPGSLSPAFSADQTSYAVAVAEGVSKLTVSAAPEDSTAKVSISGNSNLQDGDNTISVVVTAENGSKKTYTITATRAGPAPTPEPSPSPSPTPTPAVTVDLPDGDYSIIEPPAGVQVPQGFYRTAIEIDNQMVVAYKALKGDLTLFYLSNDAGDSGFYFYDSKADTYNPFTVLNIPAKTYSVLSPDSSVTIPAGFSGATLIIAGEGFTAWQQSSGTNPDQYLLYLMDSQGNKGFYLYSKLNQNLTPYQGSQPVETTETTASEATATPTPGPDENDQSGLFNPWQMVSLLLGILCLILIGLVIWLAVRDHGGRPNGSGPASGKNDSRKPKSYDDENQWRDWDDPDEDQLPPPPKAPQIRRVD